MSTVVNDNVSSNKRLKSSSFDKTIIIKQENAIPQDNDKDSQINLSPKEIKETRARKRKWWLGNLVGSLALGTALYHNNVNDPKGQLFGMQDVGTNAGIAEGIVRSTDTTVNQLIEAIKETNLFLFSVATIAPLFTKWSNKKLAPESINGNPFLMLASASIPLIVAESVGYILDKADPKKSLTPQELIEQRKELIKTRYSVGIAALFKTGLLANNMMTQPKPGDNNWTSNMMYTATLLNTLKTALTAEITHRRGKKIRDAKNMHSIVFDGVISGFIAQQLYAKTKHWQHNIFTMAPRAAIGSGLSLIGINAVKLALDPILDAYLGYKTPKEALVEPIVKKALQTKAFKEAVEKHCSSIATKD